MTREGNAECAAIRARISAYLDGEIGAAGCAEIDRHCRACEACGAIAAGLRRTIGLCRDAGKTPVPASVRESARQGVRRLLAGKPRRRL